MLQFCTLHPSLLTRTASQDRSDVRCQKKTKKDILEDAVKIMHKRRIFYVHTPTLAPVFFINRPIQPPASKHLRPRPKYPCYVVTPPGKSRIKSLPVIRNVSYNEGDI
jgi:hypothetical protein